MPTVMHTYEPRGGCKELFHSRAGEVLVSGPAGTGKSRACLEKILMVCLRTPHVRALIVRKTLSSLGSTALVTWRNFVAKEALETGDVVYYGGSAQEAPQYRFKNGSTITIGGMDRPTRIMSSEYDIIYVQEATELNLEDIDMLNTRLRNWKISFQQLLMDCNPADPHHWLKRRCNEKKTILIESRHEDNPRLFNVDGTLTEFGASYIARLDALTGVRYKRLRLGLWVSAEGQIFEDYDPAVHVLQWTLDEDGNRLPLPDEWERVWVIDFGIRNPFVCQWWAIDGDGNGYMYREIYLTGKLVEDHARMILDQVTTDHVETLIGFDGPIERITRVWTEPRPTAIVCDHDAEGRATLQRHLGMGTQPAIKMVLEGLDLTMKRFRIDPVTGEPALFFMEDALCHPPDKELINALKPWCTIQEFAGYVWKLPKDGKADDQEPVKENDHGCDCTRYFTMHKDFKGKARLRFVDY
jgi:hypothetical protein